MTPGPRRLLVWGLLGIQAGLLAWIGHGYAPMYDEIAHLPAGISHWQKGTFELYQVNPPLARLVAALPVLWAEPQTDWKVISAAPYARSEFTVGRRFTEVNGLRTPWLFVLARWACIGFCTLGGWICYRWASELYGDAAGLTALLVWCFCPNLLAWGAVITPDAAAAGMGVTAGYCYWHWLRGPGWRSAMLAGLTLGLAELTKSTWILLFVLWPGIWLLTRVACRPVEAAGSRMREAGQLTAILLMAVYFLNLGYGFEGSFQPLGKFDFISAALGGQLKPRAPGNRFRGTLLAPVPVPLPANYVQGIDTQKYDFEVGKWSYLRGQQKQGGWWYYYLYALAVKSPLGTLGLAAVAIALALAAPTYRGAWRDEIVPLAIAIAVLALVSSQTGFNRYLRYALPALPFLFIAISRVGRVFGRAVLPVQVGAAVLLGGMMAESLSVAPYSMSFFNLVAGGPLEGPRHLLDANVDWGQDLIHFQRWLDAHPEARPIHLQYFGFLNPSVIGLDTLPVPAATPEPENDSSEEAELKPGWYALSVNDLYGYRHYGRPRDQYTYFQQFQPVDRAGYSIYIYHLTQDDIDRAGPILRRPATDAAPSGAAEKH